MRKQTANLISNILNPFLVSPAIILLLSFAAVSNTLNALKWALISITFSVLPVFLVVVYLARNGSIDGIFTNVRQQRTRVYLLAGLCALVGYIILTYLEAPSILVATFAAGLLAAVISTGINLRWKISLHTAFVAASATILVILYGRTAVATTTLIPLMAWARIELKHHSLAQTATGALLAVLIVVVAFYPFVLV